MFDIEYKGANCVVITTKRATLVADPKLSVVGLKDYAVKGAVELSTETRFALNSSDAKLAIESPGEYEIADFSIRGVSAVRHLDTDATEKLATIYRIEIGDVRIALIGNITESVSEEQLEALGVIDVAIVPVGGGGYTLDPTAAANLVRRIDPKMVIPIHYADKAVNYEVPQAELSTFVTELGAPVEETTKYKVKSVATLPTVLTIVMISRS